MSRRICVVGDSHLAALRLGWESLAPDFPQTEIVFFAGPGKSMEGLEVRDGQLAASSAALQGSLKMTSGGLTSIAADYDVYVVHGLELGIGFALEISRKHRAERHAKDWRAPISDDCFAHAVKGAAQVSLAGKTIVKLRAITAAPILFCPVPMADAHNQKLRQSLSAAGEAADVVALFARGCALFADETAGRYVPQPEETLEHDGIGTQASFSSAPARFRADLAKKNDNSHMNGAYGAAVLRHVLGALTI
jgi:hypothetical protein